MHAAPATLAIDMGASKIAYGWVPDAEPTRVLAPGRLPTQPNPQAFGGAQARRQLIAALNRALAEVPAGLAAARVGLGAPGVIDPSGRVAYNGKTLPEWTGTDLTRILRARAEAPVACANDVRCWAFGEHRLGAGQGGRLGRGLVLYVSLGTGVGGALIRDGQLSGGPTGSAGEISELICADFRGRADRVENIASGNSLARYYNTLSEDPRAESIPWRDPRPGEARLPEVVQRMRAGDELARQVIQGNLRGLGRMLGALISALDLEAVVLGGGVAGIGAEVLDPIAEGAADSRLEVNRQARIVASTLGEHAPLIAAACLARETAA